MSRLEMLANQLADVLTGIDRGSPTGRDDLGISQFLDRNEEEFNLKLDLIDMAELQNRYRWVIPLQENSETAVVSFALNGKEWETAYGPNLPLDVSKAIREARRRAVSGASAR